jgi:hypothetical protein
MPNQDRRSASTRWHDTMEAASVDKQEDVERLVGLLARLPTRDLDIVREHFVGRSAPDEVNPGIPDVYAALVRLVDAATTRRQLGQRDAFPLPTPDDLRGAVRRLDTVELRGCVLNMRVYAEGFAGTELAPLFALLRDLMEAETARRRKASERRLARNAREVNAELERLGLPPLNPPSILGTPRRRKKPPPA